MTPQAICELLERRAGLLVEADLAEKLAQYLSLLLRWNERTNLTAVRDPEEVVLRHFGESLACARALPMEVRTLLDFGSGAGFPGAVCALERSELVVTLAESQGKKAAFLQELCRELGMTAVVHAGRVETLPFALRFDAVTLRAVDRMERACVEALKRVKSSGWLVLMTTEAELEGLAGKLPGVAWEPSLLLPAGESRVLARGRVQS